LDRSERPLPLATERTSPGTFIEGPFFWDRPALRDSPLIGLVAFLRIDDEARFGTRLFDEDLLSSLFLRLFPLYSPPESLGFSKNLRTGEISFGGLIFFD